VRMARVNIVLPDELYARAKKAGLNISRIAQTAVATELEHRAKLADLDRYLASLDDELGPVSPAEQADADAWAARLFGPEPSRRRPA
jgi:post-segregation antitoxin (ccd killing protein)